MHAAWTLFVVVALAHALGVASPGPDFAVVLRQTLAHGRRAGVLTACGIGSGIVFHSGFGLFGLGWAVERLPWLLAALRYGGAVFLLWLGWQALRSRPLGAVDDPGVAGAAVPPALRLWAVGFATNLLNAKALLFFVALFTTVITAETSFALRVGLAAWLVVATTAWFSLLAVTVGHPALRQRLHGMAHHLDHAMGIVLIGLALLVLLRG